MYSAEDNYRRLTCLQMPQNNIDFDLAQGCERIAIFLLLQTAEINDWKKKSILLFRRSYVSSIQIIWKEIGMLFIHESPVSLERYTDKHADHIYIPWDNT